MAGMVLLPMHFAVIFAAMIMGIRGGILTAAASPIISFACSGMPPAASLPAMTIELVTYAAIAGWLVHHLHTKIIFALICSMIGGRMVSLGLFAAGLSVAPSSTDLLRALFIIGLPGIIAQLVLIPPSVAMIGKYLNRADA